MASVEESDKRALRRSDLEAKSVATRVIMANRSTTFRSTLTIIASMTMALGASVIVILTRPVGTEDLHTGTMLIDAKTHKTVETGEAILTTNLIQLVEKGNLEELNHLKSLNMPDVPAMEAMLIAAFPKSINFTAQGRPMRMITIDSWQWHSSNWTSLSATDGSKILVSNSQLRFMGAPDGYATAGTLAPAGIAIATDPSTNTTRLATRCAQLGCPKERCSARTYMGEPTDIRCDGTSIWQWPTGVTLPKPTRRRNLDALDDCFAAGDKCRGKDKNSYKHTPATGCYTIPYEPGLKKFDACLKKCYADEDSCTDAVIYG